MSIERYECTTPQKLLSIARYECATLQKVIVDSEPNFTILDFILETKFHDKFILPKNFKGTSFSKFKVGSIFGENGGESN